MLGHERQVARTAGESAGFDRQTDSLSNRTWHAKLAVQGDLLVRAGILPDTAIDASINRGGVTISMADGSGVKLPDVYGPPYPNLNDKKPLKPGEGWDPFKDKWINPTPPKPKA